MKPGSYISLLFLIIFSGNLFSQKSAGDKYYERLEYAEAIKHYEKEFTRSNSNDVLSKLADCYFRTHKYSEALGKYQELEKRLPLNTGQLFSMAQLHFENELPEKGMAYLKQFAAVSGSKWWSDFVNGEKVLKEEKNNYLITNVKYLNTTYSEFSPQFTEGEMIFTSDRPASLISGQTYGGTATPFLNIFKTEFFSLTDSNFHVKPFFEKPDVSSHAGPAYWDSVNNLLYYTFVNDDEKERINKAGIYKIYKEGKKWGKPIEIGLNNPVFSYGHPVWLPDLNVLVFCSDKENGKGGKDIYFSKWSNNNWSEPVAVKGINTPGDEVFPSIRKMPDGTYKLYFSSNGFPGKGGLDFFSMNFDLTDSDTTITWHKELSSSHDDFGIAFEDDSRGFFSSDRSGGKGGDDIYHFIENPNAVLLCLTCLKEGISCQGKAIAVKKDEEVLQTVYTDENGCVFLHKLPDGANALQMIDNAGDEIKIKSLTNGVNNNGKLVVLDRNGSTLIEIINQDGKMIQQETRTVWLTDLNGGPAKGIRIEVKSYNGEVIETLITDSEGKTFLKKIPPGDKFLLAIDADEVYLDPGIKKDKTAGIILLDQFGKRVDSLGASHREIRISVLKIKTVDLCLYNQITGEPLAHYRVTLRAQDGTPIDTAITDAEGCYKFKKLPAGEMLLTVDNYDGGAIKARVSGMEESGITNMVIKNSNGMVIESVGSDGLQNTRTFCVFDKITREPIKHTLIHLANEKLVIIDSVITGGDGCFTYAKLSDGGRNLNLMIAADEAEFFIKGKESRSDVKINYAVWSGNQMLLDSISSNSSEYTLGILQKMILSGCLTSRSDGKPLAFTKVYFRDEKGMKLDSAITDKNGCFEYKRLGNLPSQIQVMNNGDMPFEFTMNKNSSFPDRLILRDQFENLLGAIEPSLKTKSGIKSTMICFYDQNGNSPVSGMEIKSLEDGNEYFNVTDVKGCINQDFINGKNYKIEFPARTVSVSSATSASGYKIELKSDKNSVFGTYPSGSELIVKIGGLDYVTATFKTADGKPVSDLPVEWYDERSGKWNLSLSEENGNSRHVYDEKPQEIKIRVAGKDDDYDFSIDSDGKPDVKLVDAKGNTLATAMLNANKSFTVTVRPLGGDKGEVDITGVIASSGNPVNGTTIYVKTPQGVLIQKTSSDNKGNYFFKKLPSSSMMLEVDTSDLRMKFKTTVEINGTVSSHSSGKKIAGAEIIAGDGTGLKLEVQNTNSNGSFDFNIDLDKVYAGIQNSKDNPWDKITEGVNHEIVINSIYFDYDKWNITFESERELDKVVRFLKENSTASLNIKAHTDSRGGDEYNLILSRKRAKSVMMYFKEHEIDTMRLMSFGYGETQLINNCDNYSSCSDPLHKKNRRIEFEISWNGTAHNTRAASPLITGVKTNDTAETNSTSTTNQTTSTISSETGRWYKVQITTSSKMIPLTKENFKGLESVEYYIDNGIYKYTVGKFATKEEAVAYRKNVIGSYPQAFPVILENGVRVK